MDISGYARLLADYHGNEALWNEITTVWTEYLTEKREHSPIPLVASAVILTDSAFEIPHRGILRTNWQSEIRQKLSDVPCHEEYHRGSIGSHTVVDHESALVRIFARDHLIGLYDGIDVFIEFYLCHFDEVKDLDFGRKRRNLRDSIDLEIKRRIDNDREEDL